MNALEHSSSASRVDEGPQMARQVCSLGVCLRDLQQLVGLEYGASGET